MVQLFLSEPKWNDDGDGTAAKDIFSLLNKLEPVIWKVITSNGRSEARLWLCTAISSIDSLSFQDHAELFMDFLRFKLPKRAVAAQIWQMIFEKRPRKAVPVVAKRTFILERFFEGNPGRILEWFGNVAGVGESGHRKGAKALCQYAFVNRDTCWEELEWKGKHGQSPAMVATKPHYFLDLDVLRTVENFLEYVPDFWSSDELAQSLEDGEFFSINVKFFVDCFVQLMYDEEAKDVWEIVHDFLMGEQFSLLCQHLLILLDEHELCVFLNFLRSFLPKRPKSGSGFGNRGSWLEILLSECEDMSSIDELLLVNAVISHGRQIIRFLNDEENEDEKSLVEKSLLEKYIALSSASHLAFMKDCQKTNKVAAVRLLGLLSWIFHYILLKECKTRESWESVFTENGIKFKRSCDYSFVSEENLNNRSGSDMENDRSFENGRKRKEKSRNRKRKKHHLNENCFDYLVELETTPGGQSMESGGSWMLCTDGYSSSWSKVDLPEHLSSHCFCTWMKWIFS
ncbi:hypothetical protein H6P81_013093 [Aristolochia fimbriata]|uniref:Uncharacterized protein n=1 Tax=Aristolochia fimbriata TaxID=158543 RepID=A0AAV7EFW0_ARIFI|nr:hypothetical protein H6P81_013093 [Aristolochia fimbriata]